MTSARGDGSFARKLCLLTLAGLLVRVAFLLLEPETRPIADERTFIDWAVGHLLDPGVSLSPFRTDLIFYPPLYPYFIAVLDLGFGTLQAVQWAQALLGALLAPPLGMMGARLAGPRAGLLAAAAAAFYPELVWFSAHFWSETLFAFFLWWGFERLLAADGGGGRGAAIAAGLLWGLAILTRETALYFAPLAAVWLAWGRKGGGTRGALYLAAALAVVSPWTARNWLRFHAFVPVSTAGGLNLYQGNALLTRQQVYDRYFAPPGAIEQYRFARREGIRAILERQPGWLFEKLKEEMPRFWEADSLALIHIRRGAYGPARPAWAALAAVVVLLPYLLVLGLFVAAISRTPFDRPRVLLLVFLGYYNLIHVVTHGFARYRLPALLVLFLFAAERAAAGWAGGPGEARPRRPLLAAALSVGFALALLPSLRARLATPVGLAAGEPAGAPEELPRP